MSVEQDFFQVKMRVSCKITLSAAYSVLTNYRLCIAWLLNAAVCHGRIWDPRDIIRDRREGIDTLLMMRDSQSVSKGSVARIYVELFSHVFYDRVSVC
jgi:hypothetical protein